MKNTTKKIMRRVWYAFLIKKATHPVTTHSFVLVVAGVFLAQYIHVLAVIRNIAQVQVGELGKYVLETLLSTETVNLLLIGIIMITFLSLRIRLPYLRQDRLV